MIAPPTETSSLLKKDVFYYDEGNVSYRDCNYAIRTSAIGAILTLIGISVTILGYMFSADENEGLNGLCYLGILIASIGCAAFCVAYRLYKRSIPAFDSDKLRRGMVPSPSL